MYSAACNSLYALALTPFFSVALVISNAEPTLAQTEPSYVPPSILEMCKKIPEHKTALRKACLEYAEAKAAYDMLRAEGGADHNKIEARYREAYQAYAEATQNQ